MRRSDGLVAPIHLSSSEDGREIACRLDNQPFSDSEESNRRLWWAKKLGSVTTIVAGFGLRC